MSFSIYLLNLKKKIVYSHRESNDIETKIEIENELNTNQI